ncbi:MAG: ATP-binding protein [Clostridia bacterium]|nr:ATP-binding protein [Clostridia bacterium]
MIKSKTSEVIERFANKRKAAEDAANARCLEIHAAIPETVEIDRELSSTSLSVLTAITSGEHVDEKIAQLKARNLEIRKKRASLLAAAGYPEDYTDVRFECPVCSDTGFVGTKVCECLRREVAVAALEDSGIGKLAKTQSFDTFDLKYYSGDALKFAKINFDTLKDFADNFSPDLPRNYLMIGDTGLGKTHLSTSLAKAVIDKGYRVVYDTIDGILSDFEAERFKRTVTEDEIKSRYYDCDLLIIDDLGCEVPNQFTISCLYNLINTRINGEKSTVINTNLSYDELRELYADRITSRLFGEFMPLLFKGQDIRRQKLNK